MSNRFHGESWVMRWIMEKSPDQEGLYRFGEGADVVADALRFQLDRIEAAGHSNTRVTTARILYNDRP